MHFLRGGTIIGEGVQMFRRMKPALVRRTWIAAGVLALWAVGAPRAQEPATVTQALPSGTEISNKHIAAIGGADAIRALKSWRATGTFELTGQGVSGTLSILAARPALALLRADLVGIGLVQSGYDGKNGWTLDPVTGPALLTGLALTQAADEAQFDSILHEPASTKSLTTVEQTRFDGREAYKVKVVLTSGREQFEYFDVETGLQLGTEGSRETPMGIVPTTSFTRNYQLFGTMRQATELVQQMLGIEQRVHITSFEYDVVDPAMFTPPPSIQALIKR
jgi:hypothetical protein